MRREIEQAFLRQDAQRLAQGDAAGAGTQDEFGLDEARAGRDAALQDLLPQPISEAVRQAFGAGEGLGGRNGA